MTNNNDGTSGNHLFAIISSLFGVRPSTCWPAMFWTLAVVSGRAEPSEAEVTVRKPRGSDVGLYGNNNNGGVNTRNVSSWPIVLVNIYNKT